MREYFTRIRFMNAEKADMLLNDETEFDTTDERELAELWWEFCQENGLIEVRKTFEDRPDACCLCGRKFEHPWEMNNPWPFKGEACCPSCNTCKVIPARILTKDMPSDEAVAYIERLLEGRDTPSEE